MLYLTDIDGPYLLLISLTETRNPLLYGSTGMRINVRFRIIIFLLYELFPCYFVLCYCKILYFTVVIKVDKHTKWIKLNAGQVGFYQVNYKKEWKTFKELLCSCHTVKSCNFSN